MEKWALTSAFRSLQKNNVCINSGVIKTHQRYVHGVIGYREFGDIIYLTIFSRPSVKKLAFANTFQLKVDRTALNAYRSLFSSTNDPQLDFYRTNLLERL